MKLKRPIVIGCKGGDVVAVERGLRSWSEGVAPAPDGVYEQRDADRASDFQRQKKIKPASGKIGQPTLDKLWPYIDPYGRLRYRLYRVPKPKPVPPQPARIEPRQGFQSLHSSLHEAYSIGRHMGFSDLGTHNPASTLPGGGKSDHAFWPAWAFDLGIDPDSGWANLRARVYFQQLMKRPEIAYVILGDRIWSAARASEGVRRYTAGGHLNHLHVSGRR